MGQVGGSSAAAAKRHRGVASSPTAVQPARPTPFPLLEEAAGAAAAAVAGAYALPDDVERAVASIFGLQGLPRRPRGRAASGDDPKAAKVTPDVIKEVYNVSGVTVDRSSRNKQALAEFQGCGIDAKDLVAFFKKFVPEAKDGDDTISKFVGDKAKGPSCGEGTLDVEGRAANERSGALDTLELEMTPPRAWGHL